jgi:hypothetical protein
MGIVIIPRAIKISAYAPVRISSPFDLCLEPVWLDLGGVIESFLLEVPVFSQSERSKAAPALWS